MGKVQGYMILAAEGVEELGKLVNEKLVEGWSPPKGPFVFGGINPSGDGFEGRSHYRLAS